MKIEAHAKINWALRVTGRRPDGYHELDMLMQEIGLSDTMEIDKADSTVLFVNGKPDPEADKNLIIKAVRALEKETGLSLPVEIRMDKRIPSKAGLGGGSSDCAAVLKAINTLYDLGFSRDELANIGVRLGADVPFFIYGGYCRVKGIGEAVCPLFRAPEYSLLIKHVGSGLATPEVFRKTDEVMPKFSEGLDDGLSEGIVNSCFDGAVNDLEAAAFIMDEEILKTLAAFQKLPGVLYARMSGSGSAVYAVFGDAASAERAAGGISGAIVTKTM